MKSSSKYFDNDKIEEKILLFQQTKDPLIIDELVPVLKKLIAGVIGKYKLLRRNYINDDIYQEAWVGIMEVLPKWSKEKGNAFSYLTAVVKNKIFWYLKNNYQDTSITSDDIIKISIDNRPEEYGKNSIEPRNRDGNTLDKLSIVDYVRKLSVEQLGLTRDEDYKKILVNIKEKMLSGDNINYDDLIKEIQKELLIPKKKVRTLLDRIYKNFVGD